MSIENSYSPSVATLPLGQQRGPVYWLRRSVQGLGTLSSVSVGLLALLWFALTLGAYPLLIPDEGRYVGVALSMLESGDYLVPRLDGLPFFHKPPLHYWLSALSLKVLGVNFVGARLVPALMAALLLAGMHAFLKRHASQQHAGWTALILISSPLLFGASHYANLDMTVAALISSCVLLGGHAALQMEQGRPYRLALMGLYATAGLAFLAKGLIGILIPGGILVFWLLGRAQWRILLRMFSVTGLGVLLLVATPWMWAMQARYPGFFDYYIVYQHFQRFLETGFNNPQPFWFYFALMPVATLSWTPFLFRRVRGVASAPDGLGAVRGLMLSALLTVLVFFSIPTSKLVGYVLPAIGPWAFFLADVVLRQSQREGEPAVGRRAIWSLAIGVLLCLAAVVTMVLRPQVNSRELGRVLAAEYQPGDRVVFLNNYRYDLGFYVPGLQSISVMGRWDDPDIMRTDSWRKELLEAARFEPQRGALTLIDRETLRKQLCQDSKAVFWLIGGPDAVRQSQVLNHAQRLYEDQRIALWRFDQDDHELMCGGTPKAAQPQRSVLRDQ
ncbi:glycosyltransferase family 39 protein [Alcaligenes sp. SORT26]|uniref:ArnT family glycosyltransferase n=1 Tax=Alcaligenes sp. SORT26 TaxID=2813780 RepID=UPI001FAF4FD6|nr:glycosyltransferase family 39 protein [Alcaligenes sp. SORT26]